MENNIQKILEHIKKNKFKESLDEINRISNHEINFDLINLKGFAYLNLKEFQKSYECYSKALNIRNDSFDVFFNRAIALFELGKFEKAIEDFEKSLSLNKNAYEAYENIGKCYSNLGENKKTIENYKLALKLNSNNFKLIEMIAEKLNESIENEESENVIDKTNLAIKNLNYKYSFEKRIEDNDIKNLFNNAENLIEKNFGNLFFSQTQIFRKNNFNLNCDRHFLVFRNFNVIPEFCFSCIKVSIHLDNVIDLIKLFIILNNISLPNNNLRKCMIDLRPNSKANYKGFIYCRSIPEAEGIKKKITEIIKINISNEISANIKKGCSEFNKKYPGYENINLDEIKYNSEWKKYEKKIDEVYPKFQLIKKAENTTKGISFSDIMIIKNWLFFAQLTNDTTYKKITNKITLNPNLEKTIRRYKLKNQKFNQE